MFRIYLLTFLLQFTTTAKNSKLEISSSPGDVVQHSKAMRFNIEINNTGDILRDPIRFNTSISKRADQNYHPVNTFSNGQKLHRRLKRCLTSSYPENDVYNTESENYEEITQKNIRHIKSLTRKRRKNVMTEIPTDLRAYTALELPTDVEVDWSPPISLFVWNSVAALNLIILAQCCIFVALGFCIARRCRCVKKEKVIVNKFSNYKHDLVSTPLLSGGTITTCQFQTESSSNIDRRIKCYKALHKENKTKTSMSDDILARCVKRRDWTITLKSSEVIPEKEAEFKTDVKVFGNIVTPECLPEQLSSEQEVQCLNYEDKTKCAKGGDSTGKAAQVSFTKDSIDDMLSEHGIMLEPSKGTFSVSSSFNLTSGSSKNIENVLSLYKKLGVSSDPGGKSDDLELLHMSRMSMFSSSNASIFNTLKRTKDSRSTL